MVIPSLFLQENSDAILERIHRLTPESKPLWGKMNVAQMLAHCVVTYEMVYENKHPKPNYVMQLILKAFVKKIVTNEVPYPKNSRTSPAFIIADARVFEKEKYRLIGYINQTQKLGPDAFEQKKSNSFGRLSANEWNNMFYKHLNHHLSQFGV